MLAQARPKIPCTGGSCAPIRNASCVVSDVSWSVSIPIQELTVLHRQAGQNAQGGTDPALWLLRGDSDRLFLQAGSSKDYALQTSLCSDLAYISQSSFLGWTSLPLAHARPTMFYIRLV